MSGLLRRLISFCLCFLALTTQARAEVSNHCEDLLDGTAVVDADFTSEDALLKSLSSTVDAFDRLCGPDGACRVYSLLLPAYRRLFVYQKAVATTSELRLKYDKAIEAFAHDASLYERTSYAGRYITHASAVQRWFSTLMMSYAAIRAGIAEGERFWAVDLGAGVGDSAIALKRNFPNAQVIATDRAPGFLEVLTRIHADELHPIRHDFTQNLPFASGSIRLVTSITAATLFLSHSQFRKLAAEVYRVLEPGGAFLFEFGPHTRKLTGPNVREFAKSFRDLGFEVEHSVGLRFNWSGTAFYPVLLRKPSSAKK